ncbi:MAG: QueT transporter family protein [Promethearchaeati archaeon SRVP18_Atabeyarchaeia-1]
MLAIEDNSCVQNRRKTKSGASDLPDEFYRHRTVQVAISGIVAALYATTLILFSFFSFGPIQFRVADSLMPLALVFGYSGASGLSIGCLVGNYFGFMTGITSPIDVLGGAIANLLAGVIGYKLYQIFATRGKKGFTWVQLTILVQNILVTLVVGSYMAVLVPLPPDLATSLVLWYAGLFLGSIISMNILGYLVYKMTRVGLL